MIKHCLTCKHENLHSMAPVCRGCSGCAESLSNWTPKAARNAAARTCQSGACNPIPISKALHDAILEVSREGGDPTKDAAVYLILHQLAYILTGADIAEPGRYTKSMREVES